ncbi:restriction endonuclease subunit S [Rhodococcus opacus]|uniref:restriction endonuclease subunit S n=1 Tax=Rhodococcus opacus TaxID=37919 RepID=UPI002235CA31|nr:restriction endonuclease subunit S [Rhodococcus opacus]UZG56242.1 restriction endonuclease subunit S [Rhodococcus opacus]
MIEFPLVKASDLCTDIIDCVNKTAPTVEHVTPFKMIRTPNVKGGWVDTTHVRFVEESTFQNWTRRLRPRRNDVILTREAPLGEVGILRSDDNIFLGQRLVMYRADPTVCNPRFLAYAMLGPQVQAELRRLGSGSTVEHLRVPDCESLPIPAPLLQVQDAIAGVLGSLDDLIENNSLRIAALQEIARTIYREWFVDLRYPGHNGTAVAESAIGPIPDGWEVGTVDQLVDVVKGTIDPATIDAATPAVGLEHIPRRQLILDSWGAAEGITSRKAQFKSGDILFGKIRPYFHKVSVAPMDGICSTDALVLRPKADHWGLATMAISSDSFVSHSAQTANGTKMPRADWKVIRDYPLSIPPLELAREFSELVRTQIDMAQRLMFQSRQLASFRDLLLPKLVTGQIDVSTIDLGSLERGAAA